MWKAVPVDNRTGKPYPSFAERFYGTLLVQLAESRVLKRELFPGKLASEITQFTTGVQIYER